MKRLASLWVALGVTLASCSGGHGAASLLPSNKAASNAAATTASHRGMKSTRDILTSTAVPAGWAATATQAIPLANATDLGVLPASQPITVRLGLQLHDIDGLKQVIASHTRLSPSQVNARFGPTSSEVSAVTSYLQSQGFSNITVTPNNVLVSATAPAATVAKAFNTTLHGFTIPSGKVYANVAPAYVPQALGGIVIGVLGLSNAPAFTVPKHPKSIAINHAPSTASATAPQPESPCAISSVFIIGLPSPQPLPQPVAGQTGCPRTYTPSDFWRAYDADLTPQPATKRVAIMTEGDPTAAIADFRVNEDGDGLPQVPVTVVNPGLPGTDTNSDAEGEWTLDMTASSGMAGNLAEIYVYAATSFTDSDIALMFNRWVTDFQTDPANASFGGCEFFPYLDGSMVIDDEILAEGAAQGQELFASTGDTGSFCSVGNPNGVPGGAPFTEYPASSPYVIAVGGTTLWSTVDGAYQGETAWNAGGGGISQFEYSPSWQNGIQPASSTPIGFTFRGVPDVSMDGDLQTGMIMYMQGSWTVIGGTSLSSPLMAGVWDRVLRNSTTAGFAAPLLYQAFASSSAGATSVGPPPTAAHGPFHDVLTGTNGAYAAAPGWDYTTGLGSVDVQALVNAIH
jgi:pseudomonalisin